MGGFVIFVSMSAPDLDLLERYTLHGDEAAFAEIVRRHLNLVHSAALRQVHSAHLAEEVAQTVFLRLAQRARQLAPDSILGAWLYRVTRREAIDVARREAARQWREQISTEMKASNAPTEDWPHVKPLLDEAMDGLDEGDRAVVLLRFFENKSLREVGAALGTTDDAAQKRVSRAMERLRRFFAGRGVTVGAGALAVVLSAHAVEAAPSGLAAAATAGALSAVGNALPPPVPSPTPTGIHALLMTKLQKALVVGIAILGCGGAAVWVTDRALGKRADPSGRPANLNQYVGKFEMPGHRIEIQVDGNGLKAIIDGNPAFVAYPQSEGKFVSHDHNSVTELTFGRDASGQAAQFLLVRDGHQLGELKRTAR